MYAQEIKMTTARQENASSCSLRSRLSIFDFMMYTDSSYCPAQEKYE